MSKIYEQYFSTGDFFEGLSKVMYDIRASRIRKGALVELADELVAKGQIPVTSQFKEKKWWEWSKKYVNYLMNGMSSGSVSKEYLLFYARVSKAIQIRNNVLKAVGVVVLLVILGLVIGSLIKGWDVHGR